MNPQVKQPRNSISSKEAKRLLELSLEMADLAEDILERRGEYSKEFTDGVNTSLQEQREEKTKSIESLKDLI